MSISAVASLEIKFGQRVIEQINIVSSMVKTNK